MVTPPVWAKAHDADRWYRFTRNGFFKIERLDGDEGYKLTFVGNSGNLTSYNGVWPTLETAQAASHGDS